MVIECEILMIRVILKKKQHNSGSGSVQLELESKQIVKRQVAKIPCGILAAIISVKCWG